MTDAPEATPATQPSPFRRYVFGDRAGVTALAVAAVSLAATITAHADFDNRVRAYLLRKPEVLEKLTAQGLVLKTSSPQEFQKFLENEVKRWNRVVKDNKITPQ